MSSLATQRAAAPLFEVPCRLQVGAIRPAWPVSDLAAAVLDRRVAILKGAFAPETLVALRAAVVEWAMTTPPMAHGLPLQDVGARENIHRIDDDPTKSTAPHLFHTFNFNEFATLPDRLRAHCETVFEPMRQLQNELTGNSAPFGPHDSAYRLRPQLIQYPRGGGFLASHRHPFIPQKIGLILNLSRRAVDYVQGGTRFDLPTGTVDIEDRHELGDIALFRYDLDHEVTPVDAAVPLTWSVADGRWVAVLAYY